MERFIKGLIALFLMFSCCFCFSDIKAEEVEDDTEEIIEEVLLPEHLSAEDLKGKGTYNISVENVIIRALENYQLDVNVKGYGLNESNVRYAVFSTLYSNPQLFYMNTGFSYTFRASGEITELHFTMKTSLNEVVEQKKEIAINEAVLMDLVDPSVMSDLAIVLTVHDYLASTIAYAYDDYLNKTLKPTVYTIYGALGEQVAVCQGYALAFLYFMNQFDIPCGYVSSEHENHGWNVVQLWGKWYHLDVTWDDPVYDNLGKANHKYFLLSTDTLLRMEPGRSDYVVYLSGKYNYTEAVSTNYESGWIWHDVTTSYYYHNGLWFYMNSSGIVRCYDPQSGNVVRVAQLNTYNSRGFGTGDSYYYSKSDGIYRFDILDGSVEKILSGSNISGVSSQDGILTYAISNGRGNETLVKTDIHLIHDWEPVKNTSTIVQYDCTECDEMKTKRIYDVSLMSAKLNQNEFEYDGTKKEPSVTLYMDGYRVPDVHYTVTYQDNVNAGTGLLIVQGQKKCTGTLEVPFTISPTSIQSGTVQMKREVYGYSGVPVVPDVKVMMSDTELVKNEDYVLGYVNNEREGTAKVVVMGIGNYKDVVQRTFEIDADAPIPDAVRISGKTRYETSLEIADVLKESLGIERFDVVILANGRNFADALSGSYLAAKKNAPILMVDPINNRMNQIKEYLDQNMNPDGIVYILGGTGAVPEYAEEGLTGYHIVRLSGKTRYETNLKILEEAGITNEEILICSSNNFADSLSASATGLPMLLVGNTLNQAQKEFLNQYRDHQITILGGTGAVSLMVEQALSGFSVRRIYGKTRYETSVAIASTYFDSNESIVMAYARNYPDGLCGGPLGHALNAPLVLVDTDVNPKNDDAAVAYAVFEGLNTGIVLGGNGLVKDETVRDILRMEEYDVITIR